MTREDWLRCWGFVDGTPEAAAAWAAKQASDAHGSTPSNVQIISDITSFKSPVDNSVIGSRTALREHNKRNDVVQMGNDKVTTQERAPMSRAGYDVKRALETARS